MRYLLLFILLIICCNSYDGVWPKNKIVCIYVGFSDYEVAYIKECMKTWEKRTCIQFNDQEDSGEAVLYIIKSDSSEVQGSSTVGYEENRLNELHLSLMNDNTIKHELGHVLGLDDEHTRVDRDQYIKINWNNLDMRLYPIFKKYRSRYYRQRDYEYDYNSIMQYDQYSGSRNGEVTIIAPQKIGGSIKPTDRDYDIVNDIQCQGVNNEDI